MHHRPLVEEQTDAGVQQIGVETSRQPVRHGVVGTVGHDDPDIHSAFHGVPECGHQVVVGDEVGVGQPDAFGGTVDGFKVHVADRVDLNPGHVPVHLQRGVPTPLLVVGEPGQSLPAGVLVPEVDEGVLQLRGPRADHAGVGVAPLLRVQFADVVAADESFLVVDDQEFPMIASPGPWRPRFR